MGRYKLLAAFALPALTVIGCGGGGYSGQSMVPANLSSAPGEGAISTYQQGSHQSTLAASNAGNTYTLQLSHVPNAGTTTFRGNAPAYSSTDTVTISQNGALLANEISTDYYFLNPYVPLGSESNSGTPYAVVTSSTPLPATVSVGNSGGVGNLTYYHDASTTTLDASETTTYSVAAYNPTSLLVCLNSVISGVTAQGSIDGMADGSESDCYTVDASGNATLTTVTVMISGVTLSFK